MSGFFWTSGHLGWGIFALIVFTGLWWLLADVYWRLKNTRIGGLVIAMGVGWLIGAGLIVLAFYLAHR